MIRIAHSPDSDDFFMLWALRKGLVDNEGLVFSYEHFHTQKLNELATKATHDVIAVSTAAYPQIAEKYLILPHGASIGRDYGPVVVSNKPYKIEDLQHARVGIPGRSTTAAAVFKQLAPEAKTIEIPIEPFSLAFESLAAGEVDALLLIHEGQLSYRKHNLELIIDIGKWWNQRYELPLPLGLNVIKKDLGAPLIEKVSRVVRNSIRYGIEHIDDALDGLEALNQSRALKSFSREDTRQYLGLYANQDTLKMSEDCRLAVSTLLASVMKDNSSIEYAP